MYYLLISSLSERGALLLRFRLGLFLGDLWVLSCQRPPESLDTLAAMKWISGGPTWHFQTDKERLVESWHVKTREAGVMEKIVHK